MKEKLVFLHLPKTGGTSLHHLLSQSFEQKEICPERYNFLMSMNESDLSQYRFFSGHFSLKDVPLALRNQNVVSVFRDPKERLLSEFYYLRGLTWDFVEEHGIEHAAIAKRSDLLTWLRGQDDIGTILRALAVPDIDQRGEEIFKSEAIESARRSMRSLTAIGIFELFDVTVAHIHATLGLKIPAKTTHMQITPGSGKVGVVSSPFDSSAEKRFERTPQIEEELDRLTELDRQLYDYSRELFHAQVSANGLTLAKALLNLNERIGAERDAVLADYDKALSERNTVTVERDIALSERDIALSERDALSAACDHAKRYPWKYVKHAAKLRLQ
ncbi:sulfotransferase family 2 domain-containing protein [Ruegeria atlantica]|uniref:Sulfotransferase family protein n=1 Tax=Ruegeria atlantica TaxID=81569 RepID=A0A0P1E260_9RHOB|nr:sulfotransferase family 2 domain-containing protein [Ruegeria atlantica]CUH42057.1 Sulfotransferase family protein [Ruegeria atlantica]